MSEKDIIKITKVDNIQVENTHDGHLFPMQSILEIENRGGGIRIIDLVSERDITEIDYFKIVETNKTKRKIIFKEFED